MKRAVTRQSQRRPDIADRNGIGAPQLVNLTVTRRFYRRDAAAGLRRPQRVARDDECRCEKVDGLLECSSIPALRVHILAGPALFEPRSPHLRELIFGSQTSFSRPSETAKKGDGSRHNGMREPKAYSSSARRHSSTSSSLTAGHSQTGRHTVYRQPYALQTASDDPQFVPFSCDLYSPKMIADFMDMCFAF